MYTYILTIEEFWTYSIANGDHTKIFRRFGHVLRM